MVTQQAKPRTSRLSRNRTNFVTQFVIYAIITLTVIVTLVPMIYEIAVSLSGRNAVAAHQVMLWPVDFDISAYKSVFMDATMRQSLVFTVFITFVSTLLSLTMTCLMAYPMSKFDIPGRKFFMLLLIFPMYFSGGVIAEYLWVRSLKLLDNPLVLILPAGSTHTSVQLPLSKDDPFYTAEGIMANAIHFYEKTTSKVNLSDEAITTGSDYSK